MPKEELLFKYNLIQFVDVVRAVRYLNSFVLLTCIAVDATLLHSEFLKDSIE